MLRLLAVLVAAIATASCTDGTEPAVDETAAARIVIEPQRVRMTFSLDTVRLDATVYNAFHEPLDGAAVVWSSADTTVATVDATGLVSTRAPGQVEILAQAQQVRGSADLVVSPGNPLYNECLRCHFRSGHTGWSAPATTCSGCHVTDSQPHTGIVDGHGDASAGFQLSGVHLTLACTKCHDGSDGSVGHAVDSGCITCHDAHYQTAHTAGWPTVCAACHTTDAWTPANLEHETASAGFRLLGRHADLDCTACHEAATFELLYAPQDDQDCIACHQTDYDGQHSGSGYPITCTTCHTMAEWTGATFDHDADYFPIFSGKHDNEWADCTTCHTQSGDFGEFTCFNCHKHNQTAMDEKHDKVDGYDYVSAVCLGCHANGKAP